MMGSHRKTFTDTETAHFRWASYCEYLVTMLQIGCLPRLQGVAHWDYARPAPPIHDVAYALEYVAPFRDDAECLRWLRYPDPPDRRHRVELFASAYGLTSTSGLVDAAIDVQRDGIEQVRRLANAGCQPQVGWVAKGHLEKLVSQLA